MKCFSPFATLLAVLFAFGPARAEPALWVAHTPTATVYLFGTVHLLTGKTVWRSPRIDHALAASGDLWLELANPGDTAAFIPFIRQYGIDPAHPLSTRLTPAERTRLSAMVGSAGLPPLAQFESLRPWMLAIMLEMRASRRAGYDRAQGVETVLMAAMTETGRPVHGLETIEQALQYFTRLPPQAEMQMVDEALDEIEDGVDKLNAIVAAWQSGDVDAIDALVDQDMAAKEPDAYRALIVDRNVAWARRVRDRMNGTGVSFIAVGAAHLAGPDSLQVQLVRLGIAVQRE